MAFWNRFKEMKQIKHLEFSYSFWTSVAKPETPTKTRSWILEILWKLVAIVYSCKLSLRITGDDMDTIDQTDIQNHTFGKKKETYRKNKTSCCGLRWDWFLRSLGFLLFFCLAFISSWFV